MERFWTTWLSMLHVLVVCLVMTSHASGESFVPKQEPITKVLFGLHIHRAITTTPWPEARFGSWQLVDAYVNWLNLEQRPDRWTFEKLDRYVDLSSLKNVDLLLPLAFPPNWASARPNEKGPYGLGTAAVPRMLSDWQRYIETVGRRYQGRVQTYGVWDEPNEKLFFSGTQEQLVGLAREAYEGLKNIDPNNRLVSPGAVGAIAWLDQYLQKGGGKYADIIGYHFYPHIGAVNKHAQQRPETMIEKVRQVKAVMKKHGIAEKPLWNTGVGYWNQNSDGTPESKAGVDERWIKLDASLAGAWTARTYILGWALGMERIFLYSWDHQNMGMIEPTSKTLKPVGKAYITVMDWLVGSTMNYCQNDRDPLWVCEISRQGNKKAWIVWRAEGSQPEVLPHNWRAKGYQRLNGEFEKIESPATPVEIDEQPILVQPDILEWRMAE